MRAWPTRRSPWPSTNRSCAPTCWHAPPPTRTACMAIRSARMPTSVNWACARSLKHRWRRSGASRTAESIFRFDMKQQKQLLLAATAVIAGAGALLGTHVMGQGPQPAASAPAAAVNVYAGTAAGKLSPVVKDHLERIYVPNLRSNDVYVIDPTTNKVIRQFKVGRSPQHVVPAWDLKTLWVANNAEGRTDGSLTPID